MIKDQLSLRDVAKGRARFFEVRPNFTHNGVECCRVGRAMLKSTAQCRFFNHSYWLPSGPWSDNDILYDADTIIQQLLRNSPNGKSYHIGGMYIEFDNSGSPVNPTPTISRADGVSYYDGLNSGDPDRDYLRVPLIATEEESSNESNWPDNNMARFYAQSEGTLGVHGNTFSDTVNSRVYGGALVAFVDDGDASQDLVWARFYAASANQVDKVAGSQIGLTWEYTFT